MESKNEKLLSSIKHLEESLRQYNSKKTYLNFLTIVKAFELVIEYAWRNLKKSVEDQGLEAESPKMAVKQAAKIGLIDNPELWIECINARNNSVHDYFSIKQEEYIDLAIELLEIMKKREKNL